MYEAYQTIANILRTECPALIWIDLDRGQLDSPEAFNSIAPPAALIDFTAIDWLPGTGGNETGTGQVTVKTVVNMPFQTNHLNPLSGDELKQMMIADDVHIVLSQAKEIGARTKTLAYQIRTFYVIEHTYNILLYDGPSYRRVPVQVKIDPQIKNSKKK